MMNVRGVVGMCAVAAWTVTVSGAQQESPRPVPASQKPAAVFRGGVELMNLSVTVTDKRGRTVTDLTKDDFDVFEDKKPQEIAYFRGMKETTPTPIGLGLVLDASQSMNGDRLQSMRTAVDILLKDRLRPVDELYFMEFSREATLVKEWTTDRKAILDAVRRIKTHEGTAIYNAIMKALDVSATGTHKKQVILVITDGGDMNSTVKREDVARAAQRSDVIVYAIVVDAEEGFGPGGKGDATLRQAAGELSAVTDATGGRTHYVQGFAGLEEAISQLGREFTMQYELAYMPPAIDGKYHEIAVRVKRPDVTVRHRRVYVAD